MASNQRPAHGSSAQVIEFDCTLSTGHDDEPDRATIELSTDANNTFSIGVDPHGDHPEWRFDARVAHRRGDRRHTRHRRDPDRLLVELASGGTMTDSKETWLISLSDEQIEQLTDGDIALVKIDSEIFIFALAKQIVGSTGETHSGIVESCVQLVTTTIRFSHI